MTKRKSKPAHRDKAKATAQQRSAETRTSDAATVGWTVSITMVLVCDLAAIVAHLYARGNPQARGVALFGELLLVAGAVVGVISLAMLPIVYRVRRVPPPPGLTAFAACAAVAPILAILVRMMRV